MWGTERLHPRCLPVLYQLKMIVVGSANATTNDCNVEAEGGAVPIVEGPCVCLLTLDSLEGVSSDSPILFLQESLKPLLCCVDLDPKELLHSFDCITLSKVLCQQKASMGLTL